MTMAHDMGVTLRLPARTLFDGRAARLSAVAQDGGFGLLPNHVDFVTALVPSVLALTTPEGDELIFGIDEGLLVKTGHQVDIAVRRGVRGTDLAGLRDEVQTTFMQMDEEERDARSAIARIEADVVRRFAELRGRRP